jgi:hypothetical protein
VRSLEQSGILNSFCSKDSAYGSFSGADAKMSFPSAKISGTTDPLSARSPISPTIEIDRSISYTRLLTGRNRIVTVSAQSGLGRASDVIAASVMRALRCKLSCAISGVSAAQ